MDVLCRMKVREELAAIDLSRNDAKERVGAALAPEHRCEEMQGRSVELDDGDQAIHRSACSRDARSTTLTKPESPDASRPAKLRAGERQRTPREARRRTRQRRWWPARQV